MEPEKSQKIFRMQPILCPWITSQPYHSLLWNKNRPSTSNDPAMSTNRFLNNPWINRQMAVGVPRAQDKCLPSIQQSSSQFFYFLRLMQLFPETHPATLHTVLALCKNDFFCAVDKMLYAKRCKVLCYKKNLMQKQQLPRNRSGNEATGSTIFIKNDVLKRAIKTTPGGIYKNDEVFGVNLPRDISNVAVSNTFIEKAQDLSTIKNAPTKIPQVSSN